MISDQARYDKALADGRRGSFEKDAKDSSYLAGVEAFIAKAGLPPDIKPFQACESIVAKGKNRPKRFNLEPVIDGLLFA